jgi:hypothetical protein
VPLCGTYTTHDTLRGVTYKLSEKVIPLLVPKKPNTGT